MLDVKDPIITHAEYCAMRKIDRANIIANLSMVVAEYFCSTRKHLPNLFSLCSWESILQSIDNLDDRNRIYSLLLDHGVSFTDGSDGIAWGVGRNLKYNGMPVWNISEERKSATYTQTVLQRFRTLRSEKLKNRTWSCAYADSCRVQLKLQLNRIANTNESSARNSIRKSTRKNKTQK